MPEFILSKMKKPWNIFICILINLGCSEEITVVVELNGTFYRGGLLRSAFFKVMRTKWECTQKIVTDQMGVHSKNQKGPYGSALQKLLGTKWECTPKIIRDQMGVHSKNC